MTRKQRGVSESNQKLEGDAEQRKVEFTRRKLLQAGWTAPIVSSVSIPKALAETPAPHNDAHGDTPHTDSGHGDAHTDTHVDDHGDQHEDIDYIDHKDVVYQDGHVDTHVDTHDDSHQDSHDDVAHEDAHQDTHQDS